MMSSAECLVKAAQMDAQSRQSDTAEGRVAYATLAQDWRRTAAVALEQEKWVPDELPNQS